MSMKLIRQEFGVPAKRGGHIEYVDVFGEKLKGIIKSSLNHLLRVELELNGKKGRFTLHPKERTTYLGE